MQTYVYHFYLKLHNPEWYQRTPGVSKPNDSYPLASATHHGIINAFLCTPNSSRGLKSVTTDLAALVSRTASLLR